MTHLYNEYGKYKTEEEVHRSLIKAGYIFEFGRPVSPNKQGFRKELVDAVERLMNKYSFETKENVEGIVHDFISEYMEEL